MRIDEIIASREEPVFSFEFFPPKTVEGEQNLRGALATLRELEPGFASVTYGAGGSTHERTLELTRWIKEELEIEAMAHVTCVGATREQLATTIDALAAAGIDNVLALRGDPPRDEAAWLPHPGGLRYSSELIELISERHPALCIGAACFPEVHLEAPDAASDLRYTREKVERGVSFLITQLFFDNTHYFRYVEAARAAGIDVPIIPGIMPITNLAQIKRMTSLCGATFPPGLLAALEQRSEPEAAAELGVAYATLQCAELLAAGAPGIHFFTLNRSPATRAIVSALKLQAPWFGRAGGEAGGRGGGTQDRVLGARL